MSTGTTQPAVHFNVYGLTIRFRSTEDEHYRLLTEDYGIFSCEPLDGWDLDFRVERRPLPTARGGTIVGSLGDHVDIDGSTVSLVGPRVHEDTAYVAELRGYFTASILRMLVARQCFQQVHASVVDGPGGSVVFAGAKKSGKTSLALLSVATGRTYKSNDISFLRRSEYSGAIEAFGLPQAFTVGLGAQDWFARHLPHTGLTATQDRMDAEALYQLEIGEKLQLTRRDIQGFASVDATPTRLAAIVFPEPNMYRDTARIRRLSSDEAAIRLAMLAEHQLRWGLPPLISAEAYLLQMRAVIAQATEQAETFQLQWCPDHSSNLKVLEREVF